MYRKKGFFICTIICVLLFFYLQIQVVSRQNVYEPQKSDFILILGHSLDEGELPGSWLIKRLETGLALYQEGYADKFIVSGGKGRTDLFPVADAMKQWLMDNGVQEEAILTEGKSRNTYENMKFSYELTENMQEESVVVVTNDFHMYRSMLIAEEFFTHISGAGATVDFDPNKLLAYIKEPFSIVKFKLFD